MHAVKRLGLIALLPWLVGIGGTLFSILIAWESAQWFEHSEKARFQTATDQIINLVQKRLENNVQLVCSARAFLASTPSVSREQWHQFISMQGFSQRFQGIQGVGYAPFIVASHADTFVQQHHQEGLREFKIFPTLTNQGGFVTTYIEPFTAVNQRLLGYNMSSETVRLATIEQAFRDKKPILSSKIELVQEKNPEEKAGFAIYIPLYNIDQTPKGVVFAGMKAKTLFDGVLGARYITADFELYDGSKIDPFMKLYDSNHSLKDTRLSIQQTLPVFGREWTFVFKSNEGLDIGLWNRFLPYMEAIVGSLLCLFLALWIHTLQRTRLEAYRIAEAKTEALERSERETRSIFQAMQEGVIVLNAQGSIVDCNLSAQAILGVGADAMMGRTSADPQWEAIHEDGTPFLLEERPAPKAFKTAQLQENVVMGIQRHDGSLIWVMVNAQPILSDDFESVTSVVVTLNDITAYRESKRELERYIAIVDANVIISSTDLEGMITEVSEAFCRISGYSKEELIGQNHRIVRHPDMPASLYEAMWDVLTRGLSWQGEIKNRCKDGSSYWVEAVISPRVNAQGEIVGYMAVRQDITDKKRIEELSITDRLTGLYNRLKLDEFFEMQLNLSKRHESTFSIIILDIDKFKSVNDTYGHQVGDALLQAFATLLKHHIRSEDVLGRWGGEEFLLLLPSTNVDAACALAEKLRAHVEEHVFHTVGHKTASFGVASYHHNDDAKSMVFRADEALYRAKEGGRNRVEVELYSCDLNKA